MPLVAAKCTQCGANIEVDDSKEAGICKFCGTAFITEKAINNYKINAEKVIVNGENINISNYDVDSALVAVEKLINGELYDDAKKLIKEIIENCPYDYRGWWKYSEFDYYYNDIWFDDNPNFTKAKTLADDQRLTEIVTFRDCEYKKIKQKNKKVNDFIENINYDYLDFCYIKTYEIDQQSYKHNGYLGLEIIQGEIKLVYYRKNEKYGLIRNVISSPVIIKKQIRGQKIIGSILVNGKNSVVWGIKYPTVYDGKRWISIDNNSEFYISDITEDRIIFNHQKDEMIYGNGLKNNSTDLEKTGGACYIATCVYGSYDCPQVWTLRRFRDYTLDETWYGRLFIKCYYAISPTLVKWFGETNWFRNFWKSKLDKIVANLNNKGIDDIYYQDKY